MNNTGQLISKALAMLDHYQNQGYMDAFAIGEVIAVLKQGLQKDCEQRYQALWEEVGQYAIAQSRQQQLFVEYVKTHLEEVAGCLCLSIRTVYRRLETGFSSNEQQRIGRLMAKSE